MDLRKQPDALQRIKEEAEKGQKSPFYPHRAQTILITEKFFSKIPFFFFFCS